MAAADLTAARLRELLHYEPVTGVFTRKVRTAQCHQVGDRADFLVRTGNQKGYYRVALGGDRHLAHRLAWLYVHGEWPEAEIDHINGVRGDNRIANLRDVPRLVNGQNHRRPTKRNQSGYLGVYWNKATQNWRVRLTVKRKGVHVGLFETPEEAHAAYVTAKRQLHEGCTL